MKSFLGLQTFLSVILATTLLIHAGACRNQQDGWKGKTEIELGIEIVKNPDNPVLDASVLHFEEELSLGEMEGGEEHPFSRISGIAVDREERIYVLDYAEARVKVFDRNGHYLRAIGKKGQGPGEMASPFSISITPEEAVMIQDLNNHRIMFFSLDGNFIKSVSTAEWIMVGSKTDSLGNIVALISNARPDKQVLELMKFDKELKPLITYRTISLPNREPVYNPFSPQLSWTITINDYLICGYPENYELEVYDPEGKPIRKIHKDSKPVRVLKDEIEEAKKRLPGPMRLDIPKYHSAYRDLTADEEGRIFVRTWEKMENGKGYYFDIFDPSGKYLVKIPLGFNPACWKKKKVYAIEEDENGLQVVKRYKVTWN